LTQPAKRFDVWRRLYSRFLIEPLPALQGGQPDIATTIQPITNSDELLRDIKLVNKTTSVTGTGLFSSLVVPTGKRWNVFCYHIDILTGTMTIDACLLLDASQGLGLFLNEFTATQRFVSGVLGHPLQMEEDDEFQPNVDTHSGTGNVQVRAWVAEEDAF